MPHCTPCSMKAPFGWARALWVPLLTTRSLQEPPPGWGAGFKGLWCSPRDAGAAGKEILGEVEKQC